VTISTGTIVSARQNTHPAATTFTVNCSGSNRAISFHVTGRNTSSAVTSVTINGNAATSGASFTDFNGDRHQHFYLSGSGVNNGDNTVSFTPGANQSYYYNAIPITSDSGELTLSGYASANNLNSSPSVTVTSAVDDVVFAAVWAEGAGSNSISPTSPATELSDTEILTHRMLWWTEAGASSVAIDGSISGGSRIWGMTGFSVNEAAGGASFKARPYYDLIGHQLS
jgi:hypothetical protein